MGDQKLELQIGALLSSAGWKLAVAESCTGGLLGHLITSVSGSSSYFAGGIIAYSNDLKMRLLGVHKRALESEGAVSETVAMQMATGARNKTGTDLALALTGIAGPDGGTPRKPVGLVYIALSSSTFGRVQRFVFEGNRKEIKEAAARKSMEMAIEYLNTVVSGGRL
jgi:PncC family amidohydrolase